MTRGLEEVLLLLQIHRFRHPEERISVAHDPSCECHVREATKRKRTTSGGTHLNTFERQVDVTYSAMFWCCGDIASGVVRTMLRRFFRLVACSPCAFVGALSVGALIAVACAERAAADDTPTTKTPASVSPSSAYNWNGFYAGGQLGYAWGSSNWTASSPGAPNISGSFGLGQPVDIFSESGSFFAGLQAGYNYMLPNRVVIGAEVDATFPSFPDLSGISIGGISNLTSPTLGAETFSETVLASGTARGRIGYAPGSWLFYAT
jgi:opacity protein-like surface antigen